ncbi:MAG: hypothetical protein JO131_07125 [Gammaproteobacteria bacterium]|nr:hypothetical protein [Gammaproteobacteria bacterium]
MSKSRKYKQLNLNPISRDENARSSQGPRSSSPNLLRTSRSQERSHSRHDRHSQKCSYSHTSRSQG